MNSSFIFLLYFWRFWCFIREQFCQRLISGFRPHHLIIIFLFLQSQFMVILACIRIVYISQLRQIPNFFVRHLKDRHAYRYIVGCLQIISILVFQILFLYVEEELSIEGPQVTCIEDGFAVVVFFDCLFGVWTRVP